MRAGLVGILFFAGLLALGHYVAAPFFCRGGIMIPTLDAKALCGADLHLNRSGSVLLYFGSIGIAFFFGLLAAMPGRKKKAEEEKKAAEEKAKPSAAETFEQIVAETEKKEAGATPVAHPSALPAQTPATPAAATPAVATPAAATPAPETPAPTAAAAATPPPMPKPAEVQAGPSAAEAAVAASILSGMNTEMNAKPAATEVKAAEPVAKPEPAIAETINISAAKPAPRGPFDGTNQELLERFRELKQQENVNSIAQAQRLLDESTLSALGRGIDPKQHLSDIAHLVLKEDPDLKSGVVRGVVVHVAARLKELGVANKFPNPAKGAA